MAKTIEQWYDFIAAEKDNQTQLNALAPSIDTSQDLLRDVQSPSRVADWRLWIWIAAFLAWTLDQLFDLHKADIEQRVARQYGTLPWYKKIALEFQIGDPLVWINDHYGYLTIDANKQVVKRVSVIEVGRSVRVKVANFTSGIVPLTAPELASFTSYIRQLRPPGVNVMCTSGNADQLKLQLKIYYNPLLLKATGESLSEPGVFPVEDAINGYLSALDFGGKFDINSLIDTLQSTTGVVRPYITTCQARYGSVPYASVVETYLSDAGYMEIDPLHPLNSNINYIAVV